MEILGSYKYKILLTDTVFALIVLVISTFLSPEWQKFMLSVIGIIQIPVTSIIVGHVVEDVAELKKSGGNTVNIYPEG